MLFCLCGDLTLWSSFLLDSFIFRVGEVVCIYVSKYLVVEMECIAFKVSLADVMLLPLHLETSLNELVNGC